MSGTGKWKVVFRLLLALPGRPPQRDAPASPLWLPLPASYGYRGALSESVPDIVKTGAQIFMFGAEGG